MTKIQSFTKFLSIFCIALLLTGCKSDSKSSPSILEIIDAQSTISNKQILEFSEVNGIDLETVFNWQNHWVIYTDKYKLEELQAKAVSYFPELEIKTYSKPFYNFNSEEFCKKKSAEKWNHIIMTADLVDNVVLQKEYLRYHEIQFNEWKEVPQGFCNADFQQVLVFQNGRQLMLVISIPEGKTLDELNPKTEENNPRVKEWNSIMSQFQTGIEDAPEGATWVEFTKIEK